MGIHWDSTLQTFGPLQRMACVRLPSPTPTLSHAVRLWQSLVGGRGEVTAVCVSCLVADISTLARVQPWTC